MFKHLHEIVLEDFKTKYHFYDLMVDVIAGLMDKHCENFKEVVNNLYQKEIENSRNYSLLSKKNYVPPRKLPVLLGVKFKSSGPSQFKKSPFIDVVFKVRVGEKIKKISLSSIGKNESDYLLNSVLDNSLFEVREVYREFITRQIEEINGLNQLSLLVNKVTCKLDDFSKRFLPKNVSFGPPTSNQSQVSKLFKSNLRDIYSHLSAEIFLHQKFYIEELFELIRTVKRDFEIETKAIVDSENKKRKKKRLAGTKYYPFTNPVRVTIQDGAMFSIQLRVGNQSMS